MLRLTLATLLCLSVAGGAVPGASAETGIWLPVSGKCEVGFTGSFKLGDFAGKAENVSGEVRVDPADLRNRITGTFRVPVAALRTGSDGRDSDMRKALDAERFPEITFSIESVEASFHSVADKTDVLITIKGRLKIRDVERPVTFLGRVRLRDQQLWVRGESRLKMTDFGITPPRRLFFAVRDEVGVSFDLNLAPAK